MVWDTACVLRLFKTTSFRLTALISLAFTLGFAALLLLTYLTLTATLREQIKTKVKEDLQALSTEASSDGVDSVAQDIRERMKVPGTPAGYYYLADSSGSKLAGNLDTVSSSEGWQEFGFDAIQGASTVLQADEDHQLWGQGMKLPDGSFLFVAQDAYRVLSAQESIINTFLWSSGLALLLSALAGTFLSQGFLRRIDAINTTSRAIMDGKLKERIPVRGVSDEIDRLSINLNQLFDSNQALLESLKEVSSNIAHDLRTPLSRLRQGLEEARLKSGDVQHYERAIGEAIADSDQLLATFAALLRIAQIESGTRKSGFKTFDFGELLLRVLSAYQAVAEDEGKELVSSVEHGVIVRGDADLLTQMVVNLLENAIRHTPSGTRIDLKLSEQNGTKTLCVSDTGPGIAKELHGKVLERFYRQDSSRSTAGSGLGLTLVAAIAELHQIKIELADNQPGLRVRLRFPGNQTA